MLSARVIGLKVRINKRCFFDQVIERDGDYYVDKRRVEPGLFSEAITCELTTKPDEEILPRSFIRKAVIGFVRKNPNIIKIANGFRYSVRRADLRDGNVVNDDWIYEMNRYNALIQFCNYRFVD